MRGRTVVGLTGGIASGKSAVAQMLREKGAIVVDSDVIARDVVEPGTPGLAAITSRFGPSVLAKDGSLDRGALAEIIFSDPLARTDLDGILHPLVRRRAADIIAASPEDSVVVRVIPLLVETGQADDFDLVVVVDCDAETQMKRLHERNGLSPQAAAARIAAQASREERLAVADVVVDNSGDIGRLRSQVDLLWRRLSSSL